MNTDQIGQIMQLLVSTHTMQLQVSTIQRCVFTCVLLHVLYEQQK